MRKARYVLVATLLATALCADRAMAAAPMLRPEVVQLAEKLVSRLSVSFSRTVCTVRFFSDRRQGNVYAAARFVPESTTAPAHSLQLSPFQLRLPPPTI